MTQVGESTLEAERKPGESFADWFRRRLRALAEREPIAIDRSVAPAFREAGVLAPFWEQDGGVHTVLTLRTPHLSSHQGQISFPGGRLDAGETSLTAALREAEEELGIAPHRVQPVGQLDDAWSLHGYIVTPHVGWLPERPEFVPSPDEVERVIVADVERLMDPAAHRRQTWRHGVGRYPVHYYDYQGDVIWGLTGGILHRFFGLLRGLESAEDVDAERSLRRFLSGSEQ